MGDNEKLVIMVTHGPDEPELATIPFVMAGAALASDVDIVMGFQGDGVQLVKQGVAETVEAPEFKPLHELLKTCPGPLLEAKKAMAGVAIGEVLELWSSDEQTKNDVAAWAAKVGHIFLGAATAQGYDRVFIRRGR